MSENDLISNCVIRCGEIRVGLGVGVWTRTVTAVAPASAGAVLPGRTGVLGLLVVVAGEG